MAPQHDSAEAPAADEVHPDIPALYVEHRDVMYRVAHKALRGAEQHLVDDVVQDAVLSILKKPPKNVRSWEAVFVNAVKWKIIDLRRSAPRRRELLALAEASPVEGERIGGDQLVADPAEEVADELERQEVVNRVRDAMTVLAKHDSQAAHVLWQFDGYDRSSQEIAEELGVSSSRVRQIAAQARKDLIDILSAKEVDR